MIVSSRMGALSNSLVPAALTPCARRPAQPRPRRWPAQRGVAGVVSIMMLVFLQLAMVGAVVTGTRDQDTTIRALDSVRAFYAAESGTNMAIRECFRSVDEDGDGVVGTISDDANDANDPQLSIATRFAVVATTSGSDTTHSSLGRSGSCRRRVGSVTHHEPGGSAGANDAIVMAYSRDGSGQPQFLTWDGAAWTPSAAMPDIGGTASFVVVKGCPVRAEVAFLSTDNQGDANVAFFDGDAWGSVTEVCADVGDTADRPADIAYEMESGDGLVAYWKVADGKIGFRTWDGASISSESLLDYTGVTEVDYVTLYPRPGSDQVVLLAMAVGGIPGQIGAIVWDGSSWGAWTSLTNSCSTIDEECFSLAFEGQSNHAVVVYGRGGQNSPCYRTWDGSYWSGEGLLSSVGAVPRWIRLRSDPASDKVLMGSLDDDLDVNVNTWTGSSWGPNTELENDCKSSAQRQFDLVFEQGGHRAIIAYREKNKNYPQFRAWNGSSWGSEIDVPNLNRKPEVVSMTTGVSNGELFMAVSDDTSDLHILRWTGSAWTNLQQVETDLGGGLNNESFMVGGSLERAVPPPTVLSWAETAP